MNKSFIFVLGLLIGFSGLALWLLSTYKREGVHYHANFAVYINGQRVSFAEPTYYEELTGCDLHEFTRPMDRAHMHNNVGELVHVHDSAVTWGNFFENLGWSIGPDFIRTRDQLLVAESKQPLVYLLNNQRISNPANQIIGNEDKLLISFGTTDEMILQSQFSSVPDTAREQNLNADPAGCGGAAKAPWRERMEHIYK